jgi:hypothetical protein
VDRSGVERLLHLAVEVQNVLDAADFDDAFPGRRSTCNSRPNAGVHVEQVPEACDDP